MLSEHLLPILAYQNCLQLQDKECEWKKQVTEQKTKVSGVPELREGEASDSDPPSLSASPRRRLYSLRRSGDRGHRWAPQRNDALSEPARLSGSWVFALNVT